MIEERLKELGITLPQAPKAIGSYVPAKKCANMLYVSGQLPLLDGQLVAKGPVGVNCSLDEAALAARHCVLNALAIIRAEVGSLDLVKGIVQVQGFVHTVNGDSGTCVPVINAASDLLRDIFGESGRHSRAALGVAALPLDAALELLMVVEV